MKLQLSCVKRRVVKPAFPTNADGKVLIHIGCGEKNSPEFINVDARPLAHIHVATDNITSLGDFQTGAVDLVYMCHILEHIRKDDLKDVLLEMKNYMLLVLISNYLILKLEN